MVYDNYVANINNKYPIVKYKIIDEIYTYIGKKSNKHYLFTAKCYTETGNLFQFFKLYKNNDINALDDFNLTQLPYSTNVHSDGNPIYPAVFGPLVTAKKSKVTNLVESLNCQIRHYTSQLHRKTLCYAKSFPNLENKLALIFLSRIIN